MNKIICILMFLPIFVKAQLNENAALDFQNTLRTYYYLENLQIDNGLSNRANFWANQLLLSDTFEFQQDEYSECIFSIENVNLPSNYNPYLDASVAWTIDTDTDDALENILYSEHSYVGFGSAYSNDKIIVVVKFK